MSCRNTEVLFLGMQHVILHIGVILMLEAHISHRRRRCFRLDIDVRTVLFPLTIT